MPGETDSSTPSPAGGPKLEAQIPSPNPALRSSDNSAALESSLAQNLPHVGDRPLVKGLEHGLDVALGAQSVSAARLEATSDDEPPFRGGGHRELMDIVDGDDDDDDFEDSGGGSGSPSRGGMTPAEFERIRGGLSNRVLDRLISRDINDPVLRSVLGENAEDFIEEYKRRSSTPPVPPLPLDTAGPDTESEGETPTIVSEETSGSNPVSLEVNEDNYEMVSKRLGELRNKRVGIIDEAERRTLEQFQNEEILEKKKAERAEFLNGREEAALNDLDKEGLAKIDAEIGDLEAKLVDRGTNTLGAVRARAIQEEKTRIQKRKDDQAIRKAKAQFEGVELDEEKIPDFDEANFKSDFTIPHVLDYDQINFKAEESAELAELDKKIERFALLNEEKIDFLASPERGYRIALEILKWEGLVKAGRQDEVEWKDLDKAYQDQSVHVEAVRLMELRVKIHEPKNYEHEGSDKPKPVNSEAIGKAPPLSELYQKFISGAELDVQFYKDLDIYFNEAKQAGLLRDLDQTLTSAYRQTVRGIEEGVSATEIINGIPGVSTGIDQAIELARRTALRVFNIRERNDKALGLLAVRDSDGRITGIWDLYAELATRRLIDAAASGDIEYMGVQREYIEHEFRPDKIPQSDVQERFWRPSQGGWSIDVYARTPEQYSIAADTYITDVQARTSDPSEVFQEVTQFIQQITRSTGHHSPEFITKMRESAGESAKDKTGDELVQDFLKDLTTRMQARIGASSADHSNELYKGEQYKQSMDYMAKDGEGPSRWLSLLGIPGVAEALWKMDNDPRYEMLFAMYGSHGQLASDTVAQRGRDGRTGLHWQVERVLIQELLGTRITNEANRKNTAKDVPPGEFAEIFDGLYEYGKEASGEFQGDGNIKIYKKYGHLKSEDIPAKVPKELREAYNLGRIQFLLRPKDAEGGGGRLSRNDLEPTDKQLLLRAEAKTKNAVRIAMEIYGALGEKSKRGGGVVKVRREWINPSTKLKEYYFDYVPIHQGEKYVQFAEAATEMKLTDEYLDVLMRTYQVRYNAKQSQLKDPLALRIIQKNIEDKKDLWENFRARYRAGMVAIAREKALDEFAGVEYEVLMLDRKFVTQSQVDEGVYQYKETVNNKETSRKLTPDEYITSGNYILRKLNDKEKTKNGRRGKNIVRDGGKGIESKLYEYSYEYNNVTENFELRSNVMRLNRPLEGLDPSSGDSGLMTKGALLGYGEDGKEIRVEFDPEGKLVGVRFDPKTKRAEIYDKKPGETGRRRINDQIKEDTRFEIKGSVVVEKAPVDFYLATHHFLGDWTSHTYWAYQEEDRHSIFNPAVFSEARRIRDGTLRSEDATPWARQLLMIDPTLQRVSMFTQRKAEDWERKLAMAAIEHKYQSHWRISRELHRAFFPTFATPVEFNGLYYGLQDFGGYRKMLESMRAQIGEDEERFSRRGKRLTPDLHVPYAAASEMWGVGTRGALGVFILMNLPIYRGVGTMALDKFSVQSEVANKMRSALIEGRSQDGGYLEALLLKLTNNSDQASAKLSSLIPTEFLLGTSTPDWLKAGGATGGGPVKAGNDFAYGVIESLGRYKTYIGLFSLMETGIRNAAGAFWFAQDEEKAIDIVTQNSVSANIKEKLERLDKMAKTDWTGKDLEAFLTEARRIETESEKSFADRFNSKDIDDPRSPDTGSGRHSAQIFHDTFGELLIDSEPRGGGQLYRGERYIYRRINDKMVILNALGVQVLSNQSYWAFIGTKLFPT